jgi:recombination protein RecA
MTTATVRLAPSPGPSSNHDLAAALAEVDRRLGAGVAATLDSPPPVAAIATGSLDLDEAIGIGGIPRGRITEVYGPDGAGKTTLALSVIAQAQRAGGSACFIDAEHALDLAWACRIGVDLERLILCRPIHGEQALEVADVLVGSGALDVLVVDSIAALVPKAELDGEMGERHPGVQANLLSQALRKLCGRIARAGVAVVVTNQLRQRSGTPARPSTPAAAGRSATTPRSVSTFARWGSSVTTGRWSAAGSASRSPRTRWPRPGRWRSWTCAATGAWSRRPAAKPSAHRRVRPGLGTRGRSRAGAVRASVR